MHRKIAIGTHPGMNLSLNYQKIYGIRTNKPLSKRINFVLKNWILWKRGLKQPPSFVTRTCLINQRQFSQMFHNGIQHFHQFTFSGIKFTMIKFGTLKKCPSCHRSSYFRLKRKGWMRALRFSRMYECSHCSSKFLLLFPLKKNLS